MTLFRSRRTGSAVRPAPRTDGAPRFENGPDSEHRSPAAAGAPPRQRDTGVTLIEIVVSILLLGVAGAGVLTALVTSTAGSARHREVSTATAWLQSAADHLEITPMTSCGTAASVATAYQNEVRTNVGNSDAWPSGAISVTGVTFWDGAAFAAACSPDVQLVRLRVASPNGKITQTLDVVKGKPYTELTTPPVVAGNPLPVCGLVSVTLSGRTSNLAVINGVLQVPLKKPSSTKRSNLKDHRLQVVVVTSGTCVSVLRMSSVYSPTAKVKYRTVGLTLLKGTTNTYVGSWGHPGDMYVTGPLDVFIEEHGPETKLWEKVLNGTAQVNFI